MFCKPPRVVAVVPAKLTSRRLPGKNLAQIEGQALVDYSIRAAHKAARIDEVVVSSESQELLEEARALGATPMLRPKALTESNVTNQAVLAHVLGSMEQCGQDAPRIFVLLQPTHPFRVPADIDAAIELLETSPDLTSVFALRSEHGLLGHLEGDRFVPDVPLPRQRDAERPRYMNTGAFYVLDLERTIRLGSFFGTCIGGQVISRPDLEIDIDEPADLDAARAIARRHREELLSFGVLEQKQ